MSRNRRPGVRRSEHRVASGGRDVSATAGGAEGGGDFLGCAEGVEDAGAYARLAEFGCDLAQGYHIGRPRPVLADPAFRTRA